MQKVIFESLQLFFSLFLDTLIDGPVSVFSVAKSTSVFDDPTAGIQNLTAAVNKDVTPRPRA